MSFDQGEYEDFYKEDSWEDSDGFILKPPKHNKAASKSYFMKQFVCVDFLDSDIEVKDALKYQSGDKIILPANMLQHFSHLSQTIYILKLTNPSLKEIDERIQPVYAGVIDFTAPDRLMYLPSWMMQRLCCYSGDKIDVDIVTPEKATKVTFKVPSDILDPKASLEYLLSKHTVLYENKEISTRIFEKEYVFQVLKIEPTSPAIICNADVELEISN